jgi:hydrogenase expression/formation protein HypD
MDRMGTAVYTDVRAVRAVLEQLHAEAARLDRPVTFMEVCGTHTHAIGAAGLRRMLPANVRLVSGPGCPVCVTPVGYLDHAEALAALPDTLLCTFGDLYRVPSSNGSLEKLAARGGRVHVVYSAHDALALARRSPSQRVVFLAIGFETTAPTIAAALAEAEQTHTANFLILPGNKTVPPALRALANDPDVRLDGLILPGHVSVITGADAFAFVAREHGLPAVVTGFSPADIARAILELVRQRTAGRAEMVNQYTRVVSAEGNRVAQDLISCMFEPGDAAWRGLGTIPGSGLALRAPWAHRDAARIEVTVPAPREPAGCRCGEVLRGRIDPPACPLFGKTCTLDNPVGACMVSSEGSCAAWYRHERLSAGVDTYTVGAQR